jgi:hypothetical protein
VREQRRLRFDVLREEPVHLAVPVM